MATEASFDHTSFPDSSVTPSRLSSKRKRGAFDESPAASRTSTRRTASAQQFTQQIPASTSDLPDAPVLLEGDDADSQFDLSALQQDQQGSNGSNGSNDETGENGGANQSTAAAALSYSGLPNEGFEGSNADFGLDGAQASDFAGLDGTGGADAALRGGEGPKPPVGSDEWHKVRKDLHKEVERRRRETINEGINELAKIVPGAEKNKGSILARAVQYIQKLQDDATNTIDKWTFEKLVSEQAISDLGEKFRRAYIEREIWRRIAQEAGVEVNSKEIKDRLVREVDESVKKIRDGADAAAVDAGAAAVAAAENEAKAAALATIEAGGE